jgi:SAM-dependent methyltransferase
VPVPPRPTGEATASARTHSCEGFSPTAASGRLETERVESCPLCGSTVTRTWRSNCRDWQQPDAEERFEYERCTRCSAHYLALRPRESELAKVYFTGYGPYQTAPAATPETPALHPLLRLAAPPLHAVGAALALVAARRFARQLDETYTPETPGETLLDYGCGASTFLDGAAAGGWSTVGADFAANVVDAVRRSGHEAFLVGEELEGNVADGSVSCVRMNHVIEHLYHPRAALSSIRMKLRHGGRIHISTPNPGSLGSRVFAQRWHALDSPRHVVLYRPAVLRRLLAELGFRDISIEHEVGPKDLTRSWGIVLYDRGRIAHEQIAAMATDRPRSELLMPVAALGAVLGAADRYHVFARI